MGVREGHLGICFIWDAIGQFYSDQPTNGDDCSVVPFGHQNKWRRRQKFESTTLRSCVSHVITNYVTSSFLMEGRKEGIIPCLFYLYPLTCTLTRSRFIHSTWALLMSFPVEMIVKRGGHSIVFLLHILIILHYNIILYSSKTHHH